MQKGFAAPILILIILIIVGVAGGAYFLGSKNTKTPVPVQNVVISKPQPTPIPTVNETCVNNSQTTKITKSEAQKIAQQSECVTVGTLTENFTCKSDVSVWWIEMKNIKDKNCGAACVVDINTKQAKIGWMCMGAIPSSK